VSSGELGISDSHVAKRVKRLERLRHQEFPLFATVPALLDQFAPPPTAEGVRAELEGMQQEVLDRIARSHAWAQAKAEQYRAKVGEYITEDQLQHMDAYIERAYPRGECYAADYWRTLATRLGVLL
jgi:non-ribosomal peptide synthetase component F